ncbi:MAG TPA: hypothetical protein VND64_14260 [Pirellulales bacterium]|nr:hypothetical protein [Pirellulales bacterium]
MPSSESVSTDPPLATIDYQPGRVHEVLEFLKRTRSELRTLRKVRVWIDRVQIFDVNRDYFEVRGLGYAQADVVPVLQMVNTAYKPETLHEPTSDAYKEFDAGRRYPWAHDRVL